LIRGKLKLEHELYKAIFISGKLYWLCEKKEGLSYSISKGINKDSLSYTDFTRLLNNENITTAIKNQSTINWGLGEVKIDKKTVTINSDCYAKHLKVYDMDNKWIDTKPVFINDLDKSLVLYFEKEPFILIDIDPLFVNKA
jgi:hypothetical protein